jgi:hypothetical protein
MVGQSVDTVSNNPKGIFGQWLGITPLTQTSESSRGGELWFCTATVRFSETLSMQNHNR